MLPILLSPWARWAATALVIAGLGLAVRHERGVSAGLRTDLGAAEASRDTWRGAADRQTVMAADLRARNTALAGAAATQCGTGQASAFERGRAFGRAEVTGGAQ